MSWSPGIMLVCDPRANRAQALVAEGLNAWMAESPMSPDQARQRITTARGSDWAAAAIGPPARETTCGASICSDENDDILVWSGEMFLSDSQPAAGRHRETLGLALLRRLQEGGVDALASIDGAFCGAWYSASRQRWHVFNDRQGLLPVFYGAEYDRLTVAPKAWLAWRMSARPLVFNDAGVADLLRCDNMTGDHTLIQGVHWLEGGHAIDWRPSAIRKRRYWNFRYEPDETIDENVALEQYCAILERSMRQHAAAAGRIMLGISGGLDSRQYLGMCNNLGESPTCYTVGFSYSEDVRFGRRAARAVGAPHDWIGVSPNDLPNRLTRSIVATDGLHSVRHLTPSSLLDDYLASHQDSVVLEGYLQGVMVGSYVPADDDVSAGTPPHQSHWARSRLHAGGEVTLLNDLLRPDLALDSYACWCSRIDQACAESRIDDPLARAEHVIVQSRSGRIDVLGTNLPRSRTLVRSPGCDRELLDWHATTPIRFRRNKRVALQAIARLFPRLARIPRTHANGLPVQARRCSRELCWHREKWHRRWLQYRQPWTRGLGTDRALLSAWTLATCREAGWLDDLLSADARILQWVRPEALCASWATAVAEPARAGLILSLATVETMARHLERPAIARHTDATGRWSFEDLDSDLKRARRWVDVQERLPAATRT